MDRDTRVTAHVNLFNKERYTLKVAQPAPVPSSPPTPATPAGATEHPAIAIIEEYQLTTATGDIGVSRSIGGVLNVAPRSKKTVWVRSKHSSASSSSLTSSVLESREKAVSKDLSNAVRNSAEQSGSKSHSDWQFDASFHAEAEIGFGSGSVDAEAHAKGASNEVRDSYRNAVDSAVSEQVSATESSRNQTARTSESEVKDVKEDESVETFELNNLDSEDVLSMMLCQLSVERLTALSLVNVKLGFFDAAAKRFEITPLSGLTTLLERVIPDTAHRASVRAVIVSMLENVFDYHDEARKLIEKRMLEGGTGDRAFYYRVVPDLRTDVQVLRTNGSAATFTVPGIAIKSRYSVTPIPYFGMVRGTAVG